MPTSYLINRTLYPPQIKVPPAQGLGLIVVIPCFNESNLITSLEALYQCKASNCSVEIIVVINDSETSDQAIKDQNEKTFQEAKTWAGKHSSIRKQFHILYYKNLGKKKAGVGLARKIGMDEAAMRLEMVDNPRGIITGFDADSICEDSYFKKIEAHFRSHPEIQAASIWYEHPLAGSEFNEETYQAIAEYELHLRYFTLAKRFANYPHAFETIGSSMAVRADAYQQQGGMNTRKAGEDFYFLNKFIVLGKLNELNETCVIPSPRVSDRVPFGTGKAVADLLHQQQSLMTYAPASFLDFKKLVAEVPKIYERALLDLGQLPKSISEFLKTINGEERVEEILKNTTDFSSFEKRFFRWFDPFIVMKFMHFSRDHFYPNIKVEEAGNWILENYFGEKAEEDKAKELLLKVRELMKQDDF